MDDFAKVKQELDLYEIIPALSGFKMGKHHLDECPFCGGHDCFSINNKGRFYKCFQCNKRGDIFDFLKEREGFSSYEALHKAADLAGITLINPKKTKKYAIKDKLLLDVVEYYRQQRTCPAAQKYFQARGHSDNVLESMRVGWSDGKLHQYLSWEGYTEKQMLASGLVRKNKNNARLYDFFAPGLAVFPHFLEDKVAQFTTKDPTGAKKPYQLPKNSRHKKWLFYNQDAFERDDLILVEGENDTLSMLDAGISTVIGMIGQISNDQLEALKKYTKHNRLYLWMDNDFDPGKPMIKGHGYIRRIVKDLPGKDVRVIVYPEEYEDPDAYIQSLDIKTRRKSVDRLLETAVDYITWEIQYADQLKNLDKKLNHLKSFAIFRKIAVLPDIEQQVFFEKVEGIGFSRSAVYEEVIRNDDLRMRVTQYLEDIESKWQAEPNMIAGMIHDHFAKTGRFYKSSDDRVYLLYRDHIYEVGNNRPFNALLKLKTGLLPTDQLGRATWESLASEGYLLGERIDICSWLHTDRSKDTIWINLNSEQNKIIKISPDGIDLIANGLNDDNVFLKNSVKIKPFALKKDVNVQKAVSLLRQLLFDNFSCARDQKYLIISWFISCFLSDFSPHVSPLLKAEGETASGKTTAARLMEYLIYGDEHLGEISVAGAYADASQSPLLVIDNLENRDLKVAMLKFLLLVATRGSKVKRKGGTESDTTQEKPKSMVMVTAIEPFIQAELINRTFAVNFAKRYHNPSFVDDEITRQIIRHRDYILSGIFGIIQRDILPNLDKRTAYITALNVQYKGHAKDRLNSYIALMMLILEQLLKYWDQPDLDVNAIAGGWIKKQNNLATEQEVSSNDILKLLDGLIREYRLRMADYDLKPQLVYGYDDEVYRYKDPEYGLTVIMTKPESLPEDPELEECIIEFECTSRDLCYAFGRFCKNNNLANPYPSASIFGSRLKNDRHLLAKGDWKLVTGNKGGTHYKIVRGQRFLKFRHKLIR